MLNETLKVNAWLKVGLPRRTTLMLNGSSKVEKESASKLRTMQHTDRDMHNIVVSMQRKSTPAGMI